jgi:hypothetical protein
VIRREWHRPAAQTTAAAQFGRLLKTGEILKKTTRQLCESRGAISKNNASIAGDVFSPEFENIDRNPTRREK